ncbi:hypothetical protein [Nocardiopsis sp. FR26]|uniref:hypothetical protein n=1 Tax=Nocardiopsis sp. FR26 TaxID=2605987 RepID=UPI00135943AB|nr:hypothetical protein [Nocardiopsis sp. FR26]
MKRAKTTFAAGQRVIARGRELPDADPLVKRHPHLFEDAPGSEQEKLKRPARRRKTEGGGDADSDT